MANNHEMEEIRRIVNKVQDFAEKHKYAYLVPEQMLYVLLSDDKCVNLIKSLTTDRSKNKAVSDLKKEVSEYIEENVEKAEDIGGISMTKSYQKLLNSGFKPLEKLQAVKTIRNILKECGVEYIDFLKWMVIESLGDSFGFSRLEDACDFSITIAPKHPESAISKAIMTWSHVKNTLSSKMSGLSRLPYKMIEGEHSFYVDEERKDLIQTLKNDLAWNEINEWIKKNPIVEFARRVYADDSRKNRNVEILNHYLKWD